jgi:hypothetical protein
MFITNKTLHRRTFLRGMGATVALPLLDAMIPARSLLAFTAAKAVPRLAFVYFPHGAVMDEWTLDRRILQPLAPFGDRLTVAGGIENPAAYGPVHAITPGTWLSGRSPRERAATVDQIAADHFGCETPLRSIAVATEEPTNLSAGIWEGEYDPGYATTISFRADTPVPMEFRPRAVFDALFPHDPAVSSVLDLVAGDTYRLRKQLGPADVSTLSDYLDTVRDCERRCGQIDSSFPDRMALMFDLIALAFRADITRVATMMMAAEASTMTYEHLGVSESFHALSHHQNDPEKLEKLVRIQTFHTRMFANFVESLAAHQDGDGSVLDRSLILFGSNMSNGYAHDHYPLPLAVVGDCGHLQFPERGPIAGLLLSLLRRASVPVPPVDDSAGECAEP